MPFLPSRQDIHVNAPLTNLSVAYMQDQSDFVADKVFPSVPVKKQSDRYVVFKKEYWFQTKAQKRAPVSETVGAGYKIDNTPTYFCDTWAVHHDIAWEDYENADEYLTPDSEATELVSRHLKLRQEQNFIDQYMRPGVWGGFLKEGVASDFSVDVDGTGYWDSSTSDPAQDVDIIKRAVKRQTGYTPNTVLIGTGVYFRLRNHPAFKDVFKYVERGIIDADKMASVFGVDRLFVSGAVIDKSASDLTPQLDFMTDNDVLVCYAAPRPGLKVPSAGYTFNWVGASGAGEFGNTITKLEVPLKKANRIEGEQRYDMRMIGRDLGVLLPKVLQKSM